MAGATMSTSRASPGPRSMSTVLPGPRLVLHRPLDPHRVGQFHLVDLGLQTESEGVKPQLQDFFQFADTLHPVARQPQIKILGGAGHAAPDSLFWEDVRFRCVRAKPNHNGHVLDVPACTQHPYADDGVDRAFHLIYVTHRLPSLVQFLLVDLTRLVSVNDLRLVRILLDIFPAAIRLPHRLRRCRSS
jgi:hypothetical protein